MRTAIMIAWLCAAHAAIPADTATEGMEVGGRAMISGVRFACGHWKTIRNSGCPAANQGSSPKIAVYTPVLNKNLWKLAAAIEREIQADDSLKYSFIEVIDGTDPKDLTIEERTSRLTEIHDQAADRQIKLLTLGVAKRNQDVEMKRLNLPSGMDIAVLFLNKQGNQSRIVKFLQPLSSDSLTDEAIADVVRAAKASRNVNVVLKLR